MIEKVQRAYAVDIMSGEDPSPDAHEKAVIYGLLARGLESAQIQGPLFGELSKDFIGLTYRLNLALIKLADEAYEGLSPDVKQDLEARMRSYMPGKDALHRNTLANQRLIEGAKNAGDVIGITLRTIAKLASEGHAVSWEALLASSRVPHRFALLHFEELELEFIMRTDWSEDEGGDNGAVYLPNAVRFHPTKGLQVSLDDDGFDMMDSLFSEDDPRIGCPATFDADYIRTIFAHAAEHAVASGLINCT